MCDPYWRIAEIYEDYFLICSCCGEQTLNGHEFVQPMMYGKHGDKIYDTLIKTLCDWCYEYKDDPDCVFCTGLEYTSVRSECEEPFDYQFEEFTAPPSPPVVIRDNILVDITDI